MFTESAIQQSIVIWFRNNYCLKHHNPRCAIFSVPNERKNVQELTRMKATGLLSGVADLICIIPNKVIFLELKTQIGKQSENQKEFEKTVTALGFEYHVIRSLEEFQQIFTILK
jgi:hypothetical protein